MGSFQTAVQKDSVKIERCVYAPAGDVPALLVDVTLTNMGTKAVTLSYYEYWDVNIEQLVFQAFRSGILASIGDADRRVLNRKFKLSMAWDESTNALRFHMDPPVGSPQPSVPDDVCWQPPDIFLADLSGKPDGKYVDKRAFFGKGGAEKPDAIGARLDEDIRNINDIIMPYCMVLRREVQLGVGDTIKLRFAYGTLEPEPIAGETAQPPPMPDGWKHDIWQRYYQRENVPDPFADMVTDWKKRLAYFNIGEQPHLQREMAWHAYYLQSSTVCSPYFEGRIVPQGSVYLYGHGLDGVPRDFALFALPLVYLNPALARDVLSFIMHMTAGTGGQIAYGYTGHGLLTDALVHKTPSDLDLFFFLALTEYLAATGDIAFLDETISYYPGAKQPNERTVLDHIRVAYHHLINTVGVGENNLIRVLDGDWSDDVVLKNVFPAGILNSVWDGLMTSPALTVEKGESVFNSQMALYILPRIANLLASQNAPMAKALGLEMQTDVAVLVKKLTDGVRARWVKGNFYSRAILRYWWGAKRILHEDQLDLEGQVWALISDFEPESGMLQALRNSIFEKCDAPSPIGAVLSSNQVWPAVSQMLTWGYTHRFPKDAWRSFVKHTFATKAAIYGKSWINIWTGPDGVNGRLSDDPGSTYETAPVTPMTDFPAMNNNQHAMALLALLRVCGIEPSELGDGLRIRPQIPRQYELDVTLLRLSVTPTRISGIYRAHSPVERRLYVMVEERGDTMQVTVNGQVRTEVPDKQGYVTVILPASETAEGLSFEIAPV